MIGQLISNKDGCTVYYERYWLSFLELISSIIALKMKAVSSRWRPSRFPFPSHLISVNFKIFLSAFCSRIHSVCIPSLKLTDQLSHPYILTRNGYEHKNSFKTEKLMKIYLNELMVRGNGLYSAHYGSKGQPDCKQRRFCKNSFISKCLFTGNTYALLTCFMVPKHSSFSVFLRGVSVLELA
jgi:hypothetical protein